MTPENIVALVMVVSLIAYVLTGGADFGGGVWDLLATGKRAKDQRKLIAAVLAPIWEANHIWLIVLIVLLFVCFPSAYSTLLTFLHFPFTVMLFGIVLRGSAFVFRKYEEGGDRIKRLWSLLFAIGSIVTPFFLGLILGAITVEQPNMTDLFEPWMKPFPIFCGLLTLVICAYLAAVYLTNETRNHELADDFRARALISGSLLILMTLLGTVLAYYEAGNLFYELIESDFSHILQVANIIFAGVTLFLLYRRNFTWARFTAMAQVIIILFGWMITQYPDLITGHVSIIGAAAPRNVLIATLTVLGIGSVLLVPALIYLFYVFKKEKR